MKVLWLCNIVFPHIAQLLGIRREIGGGWMIGLLNMVREKPNIDLSILSVSNDIDEDKRVIFDNVTYYIIPSSKNTNILENRISKTVNLMEYDVIHLFGSEYLSSYALVKVAKALDLSDRLLLHIQGLVSVYAYHYVQGIPEFWIYLRTPRDLIKSMAISYQRKDFIRRGRFEVETIKGVGHIGGRTYWDKACTYHINPQARYHHHGEILRESFYHSKWDIDQCERHSIFISQGNYPVKGFHHLLKSLPLVISHFPDVKVYVSGFSPLKTEPGPLTWLKQSSYGHYLSYLILKYNLKDHIIFTGPLSEEEMKNRYLKSHVFVCPSNIENSPNSLGEAMLLGMPCISSDVGGTPDMLIHKKEGFLYPVDAPYMLAYYLILMFKDDKQSVMLGSKAREHAFLTHSKDSILSMIENTYVTIKEEQE